MSLSFNLKYRELDLIKVKILRLKQLIMKMNILLLYANKLMKKKNLAVIVFF